MCKKESQDIEYITQQIINGNLGNRTALENYMVDDLGYNRAKAVSYSKLIHQEINRKLLPQLAGIELFLTEDCPMACDYCFVSEKNTSNYMTFEVARKSVDLLFHESRNVNELSILFFGGEPLLAFDLITEIVPYIAKKSRIMRKQVLLTTTTNGILLNEAILEYCKRYQIRCLISIDGNRASHDAHRKMKDGSSSFDILYSKLPLIMNYFPSVGARMTVANDLVNNVFDNFRFLVEIGFTYFIIALVDGIEISDLELRVFKNELYKVLNFYHRFKTKDRPIRVDFFEEVQDSANFNNENNWGCRAGRGYITVVPNGDIIACSKMVKPDSLYKQALLGNIEDGITNLNLRLKLNNLLPVQRDKCNNCVAISSCTGNCYAANWYETNDIFKPGASSCRITRFYHSTAKEFLEEIQNMIEK